MGKVEEWRSVVGYEGLYEVSSTGKVRGVDRYVGHPSGGLKLLKRKVLKQGNDMSGYCIVSLSKNGIAKTKTVHRLVMMAFVENEKSLPVINHKDENPSNNHVGNLEWCTNSHNTLHSFKRSPWKKNKGLSAGRLDDYAVMTIWTLKKKLKVIEICEHYKKSRQTINAIFNGNTHKKLYFKNLKGGIDE